METRINCPTISIILPTYNERVAVPEMYARLKAVLEKLSAQYEIIFVDDNSPDGTIDAIKELRRTDQNVKFLLMSHRVGEQISIMAGLEHANGDAVVTMDSDLEHPPEYIPQMLEKWNEGFDVVIMKRKEKSYDSFFKKWTEIVFYRLLRAISKTPIHYRFSGFALMGTRVVRALRTYHEHDPFIRGLIALVGFKQTEIFYTEGKREVGESKYQLLDMLKLATTGITSFSEMPLYFSLYTGLSVMSISFLYAVWVLYETIFLGSPVRGWPSTMLMILFLGGVQLISIGLLGIYISKIFLETKKRPNYILAEAGGFEHN
ncbi:MAG: glycosyltransferase family 2 protein [bacterium]|nr:glycosyltransferase family 2 protein [bacterium]